MRRAIAAPRTFPLLDRLIPAVVLGDKDGRRRARLLVAFVLSTALAAAGFLIWYWASGERALGLLSLVGVTSTVVSLLLLRGLYRTDIPGAWHTLSCTAIVAAQAWQSGLTYSPSTWFLTILPSVGLVLVGLRTTLSAGAACAGVLVAFAAATSAHAPGASHPVALFLMCQLVLLGFSLVIAGFFEVTKESALAERDATNSRLEREVEERQAAEERLKEIHGQLMTVARRAGMAEVTSGALHNVGNALNSVRTSASLLRDESARLRIEPLSKLAALLRSEGKGEEASQSGGAAQAAAADYVDKLYDHLSAQRSRLDDEARHLLSSLEHIEKIVATQQAHASSRPLVEDLDLGELLRDALRLEEGALVRHGVTVARDSSCDEPCPLQSDRHRILQILVNLVSNARFAVAEQPPERKRIRVALARAEAGRARVFISDDGRGMDEATLTRAFEHGFTTREDGNGFGLHASALAARELGGSLEASSDGRDRGATFVLDIPTEIDAERAPPAELTRR